MWFRAIVLLLLSVLCICRADNDQEQRFERLEHFALYSLTQTTPNYLSIWYGNNSGISYVAQVATGGDSSSVQSQNPLVVFQRHIFAINAVSSTVSMFSIQENNPTQVTLVGTPVASGGDWPVSVTAAETNFGPLVCVTNSGASNGFACFTYNSSGLFPSHHGINVSLNLSLTTPPGNHLGPAQISITPDGNALVVVVKGFNPPLYLYTLESKHLVQSTNMGSVNFAFVFDSDHSIVLVDASPYGNGSGIIQVNTQDTGRDPSITFATNNYFLIPGQSAACWVTRSSSSGFIYASNLGSGNVTELALERNSFEVLQEVSLGTGSGPSDLAIVTLGDQEYLFVNAGGDTSIRMFKLSTSARTKPTLIQSESRADGGGQGLASFVQPLDHGHF